MAEQLGLARAVQSFLQGAKTMREIKDRTKHLQLQEQEQQQHEKEFETNAKRATETLDLHRQQQELNKQIAVQQLRDIVQKRVAMGAQPNAQSNNVSVTDSQHMGRVPGVNDTLNDTYDYGGDAKFAASDFATPGQIGQANLDTQQPLLEARGDENLALVNERARAAIAETMLNAKNRKELQDSSISAANTRSQAQITAANKRAEEANRTRLTAAQISANTSRANNENTVSSKLVNKPVPAVKQKQLTQSQQEKYSQLDELETGINEALALGEKTKFSQHKGMGAAVGKLKDSQLGSALLGSGSPDEVAYRTIVNKLLGSQALSQGGKSFTKTERDLLLSYAVDLSTGKEVAPIRLKKMLDSVKRLKAGMGTMPQTAGDIANKELLKVLPNGIKVKKNLETGLWEEQE